MTTANIAHEKIINEAWQLCPAMQGFSAHMGPFYEKQENDSNVFTRLLPLQEHHQNPEGVIHGGVLTAVADYGIYRAIGDVLGHQQKFATINLNCDFLAAATSADDSLKVKGKITRLTKSLVFAEGMVYTERREVLRATGIWKLISSK